MAELMKQRYNLLTFEVRLDMAEPEMRVIYELEADDNGDRSMIGSWSCATSEMGIPQKLEHTRTLYTGYEFHLPDFLPVEIQNTLQQHGFATEPLWLHLVKPCGYLGLIPWEMLLQPVLKRPILRLPEFLTDPPKESPPWLLEVALCASMPAAKDPFFVVGYLHDIALHIVGAAGRDATVHIFTDSQWLDELRGALAQNDSLGDRVRVHDPVGTERFAIPGASGTIRNIGEQIENPWLLWMREALGERRVDVMHFIGHGYLARETGALALAESPLQNADLRMARFVGSSELIAFLTQIGSWSTIFTSPQNNYSEMGLRLLADTIAQRRPGTVVHHEVRLDDERVAIGKAYDFLFSGAPPPITSALAIYCHPARLIEQTNPEASADPAASEMTYWEKGSTPQWVAATERFIEQSRMDAISKGQGSTERSAARAPRQQAEIDTYERTLQMIQEIIAENASNTAGDSAIGGD